MATNTSISLDDHFAAFLAEQVGEGRYRSASEVVRAALRLLEDREVQLAALRAALEAGEASGEPEVFDFDAFIAAKAANPDLPLHRPAAIRGGFSKLRRHAVATPSEETLAALRGER